MDTAIPAHAFIGLLTHLYIAQSPTSLVRLNNFYGLISMTIITFCRCKAFIISGLFSYKVHISGVYIIADFWWYRG